MDEIERTLTEVSNTTRVVRHCVDCRHCVVRPMSGERSRPGDFMFGDSPEAREIRHIHCAHPEVIDKLAVDAWRITPDVRYLPLAAAARTTAFTTVGLMFSERHPEGPCGSRGVLFEPKPEKPNEEPPVHRGSWIDGVLYRVRNWMAR